MDITIDSSLQGLRLDKALADNQEIRTRSRASFLIDSGLVTLNSKKCKSSSIVNSGDKISIQLPDETPSKLQPLELPLDILFEDEDIIVINKPSGLVVHPAAGHAQDTLVNALLAHCDSLSMKFGEDRPGIVHRLDKETSGLLVVAKNDLAHENLTRQFQARTIHRIYLAVAIGSLPLKSGKITTHLARHPIDRKRYASSKTQEGKLAITNYTLLKTAHGLSYYKVKLETGRTHQIRVHLSEHGAVLVGDLLYGANKKLNKIPSKEVREQARQLNRFLLHATELGFEHPINGKGLHFAKEWPEEISKLLADWSLV